MEQIYHNRFYTMGTRMHIILPGVDEQMGMRIFTHCKHEAERVERKISRFIPQCDLSRLNKVAFEKYALVDAEFFDILLAGKETWLITAGALDPSPMALNLDQSRSTEIKRGLQVRRTHEREETR